MMRICLFWIAAGPPTVVDVKSLSIDWTIVFQASLWWYLISATQVRIQVTYKLVNSSTLGMLKGWQPFFSLYLSSVRWLRLSVRLHGVQTIKTYRWLSSKCKKDATPLLTHWSYVFLALTHRYCILWLHYIWACNYLPAESQHRYQFVRFAGAMQNLAFRTTLVT